MPPRLRPPDPPDGIFHAPQIPPIPPGMEAKPFTHFDGFQTYLVSVENAGKLMGVEPRTINHWLTKGEIDGPRLDGVDWVCVDTLWNLVPDYLRTGR